MKLLDSKNLNKIAFYVMIFISITLIVVGIFNLRDAFPKELFYTPDESGFTGENQVPEFIALTLLLGIPRQLHFYRLVGYYNVFPIQLFIYGGILLILSSLCLIIKKHKKALMTLLMLFILALMVYLGSLSINYLPYINSIENPLYEFDYIYIVIVLGLLAIIFTVLIKIAVESYGKEMIIRGKKLAVLIYFSILLDGVLAYLWVRASFMVLATSLFHQNSPFCYDVSSYGGGVSHQMFLICPSILYAFAISLAIYLTFVIGTIIVRGDPNKKETLNKY